MITEIIALGGAIGIAITVFIIILLFADKPVKAFIMALMSSYTLFALFIYIINRIFKHKEEKHTAEKRHE
jgi:hypothetical protein